MSYYDGTIKYTSVRLRIISCDKPTYWYAGMIGQTVNAQKRTYTNADGSDGGYSYWVYGGPGMGYSKWLPASNVEVVETQPGTRQRTSKKQRRAKRHA